MHTDAGLHHRNRKQTVHIQKHAWPLDEMSASSAATTKAPPSAARVLMQPTPRYLQELNFSLKHLSLPMQVK